MAISFIKVVLLLAWLAFWLHEAISVTSQSDHGFRRSQFSVRKPALVTCFIGLVVLLLVFPSVGYVDAGNRGVVTRFGAVTGRVLDEGIYAIAPIVESVQEMSVQVEAEARKAAASSRDLQNVETEVTLNYALMPDRVATVYQTLRRDYSVRIVDPAIQEAVKAATARFDAEQLITQRQQVSDAIRGILTERLQSHGIRIDAISLTNFAFSKDFADAIEAKVTATQKALKAENDLKRIETEARQRVATAQGEAEAIRIQAESVSKQGGESYVALKWVEKWDGKVPSFISGGGQASSLLLQLPSGAGK